jgi:hypothetical protein
MPIWVNFGGPWTGKCWHILCPFGNLVAIWHIFPRFGMFYQEKSGNPGLHAFLFLRLSNLPNFLVF